MGSVKLEQSQKVENDQERGREITERGSEKLEEAEVSRNAISICKTSFHLYCRKKSRNVT